MIESNFSKKVHTAATSVLEKFQLFLRLTWTFEELISERFFQKSISKSVSIHAIVSHLHFLMGFNHLSISNGLQKTIIVQLKGIPICF